MLNEADSFADKLERHRRAVTSRACNVFNSLRAGYQATWGHDYDELDGYYVMQGCINAAEHEWRAGFLGTPEDRRALPDYRRLNG